MFWKTFEWAIKEKDREPEADEFRGSDGLIYCRVCGKPKQTKITMGRLSPGVQKTMQDIKAKDKSQYDSWERCFLGIRPIPCDCGRAEIARREKQAAKSKDEARLKNLRDFRGVNTSETFENSDGSNQKAMEIAKRYVEKFGNGSEKYSMLFHGGAITGKTYAANSVGNALSSRGHTVFCTTAQNYIDMKESHKTAPEARMWIIDDLKELKTYGYKAKYIVDLIESRRQHGLPTIVTSKLSRDDFLRADDDSKKVGVAFSRYVGVNFTENHAEILIKNSIAI